MVRQSYNFTQPAMAPWWVPLVEGLQLQTASSQLLPWPMAKNHRGLVHGMVRNLSSSFVAGISLIQLGYLITADVSPSRIESFGNGLNPSCPWQTFQESTIYRLIGMALTNLETYCDIYKLPIGVGWNTSPFCWVIGHQGNHPMMNHLEYNILG